MTYSGWYVAKSHLRKEAWLTSCLSQLGVEVYFPRIMTRRRGKLTFEPLFPTYLFCLFSDDKLNWPAIRWAPGLKHFLSADGKPSEVSNELVDLIQERVEEWNGGKAMERRLKRGNRVRVANGPFANLEGIFSRYVPSRQRCRILLQVVGRQIDVEIGENDLSMPVPTLAS